MRSVTARAWSVCSWVSRQAEMFFALGGKARRMRLSGIPASMRSVSPSLAVRR